MSDETKSRLRALQTQLSTLLGGMTARPWDSDYMYGAIRHIQRNVETEGFYSGTWHGVDRYEGTKIAELVNMSDEISASLLTAAERVEALERALREARIAHGDLCETYSEDGEPCSCGADAHNARIDAALEDKK